MKFKLHFQGKANRNRLAWLLCLWLAPACQQNPTASSPPPESVAANDEVARYMAAFEGRGDQADDSQPIPAEEVLQHFRYPDDLALDLIASEPLIHQPLFLNFDHRGRLWVVQYSQYPFPAGLKVTGYDFHLRATFDKVPDPPPTGVEGADKITVLEDTDGDGVFDKATDAITGLNIATSITWGRGQIWVLNPPYLLAYPDPDGDGIPNGPPRVHLRGFGLEDTHAVANSLRWGPDGWLYGAQGSTCTADISSSVSKNIRFQGQGIWRYHPETEVFELFAEGGGNTFCVEIDEKGRLYSGHNGGEARGQHYKQGAYYVKNWGKHGALTNPYAFGFFPHMDMEGEKIRFTHAFIKYEGGKLPARYDQALIGPNPLHNYVQVSRFEAEGSTFRTLDTERVLQTDDHWFRPVDVKAGPDGGVYLADWYDSRLSHVDPRDTWHRASGRVYRLRSREENPSLPPFDLSTYSTEQLISLLAHENKWFRQEALRQLGDRKDASAIPLLEKRMRESTGQIALEALWALNLSGGLGESQALAALKHGDPHLRRWAVRLVGDARTASPATAARLIALAKTENDPEVRSQLAASAKRLPGPLALPIIRALLAGNRDSGDPHISLQIWWAIEDKAETDREAVLALFADPALWKNPLMPEGLASRIMQRYLMADGPENEAAAVQLLKQAKGQKALESLMAGVQEGLRGRDPGALSPGLKQAIGAAGAASGSDALALQLQQGNPAAAEQVGKALKDEAVPLADRLNYLRILGERPLAEVVPVLLDLAGNSRSGAMRQAALTALARYDQPEIAEKVVAWYPDRLRADPHVKEAALNLLAARPAWALYLLEDIDRRKQIVAEDIPPHIVRQIGLYENTSIQALTLKLWPQMQAAGSQEKQQRLAELTAVLRSGKGDTHAGKSLFQGVCGACHRLFGEGGAVGPDLTGYDRRSPAYLLAQTLDPNAEIREGYVNYRVRMKDGSTLSGVLSARKGDLLTFRPVSGAEIVLPESQIETMQAQATSLMPERLLDALTDQQVRDLFAYIMQ